LKKIGGAIGGEAWAEEETDQVEHRAVRVYRKARRPKQRFAGLQVIEED